MARDAAWIPAPDFGSVGFLAQAVPDTWKGVGFDSLLNVDQVPHKPKPFPKGCYHRGLIRQRLPTQNTPGFLVGRILAFPKIGNNLFHSGIHQCSQSHQEIRHYLKTATACELMPFAKEPKSPQFTPATRK